MLEFPLAVKYKNFKASLKKKTDELRLGHVIAAFTLTGFDTTLVTQTGQLPSKDQVHGYCVRAGNLACSY